MLQREKSAEAACEGLSLGSEDLAERGNLCVFLCDGHLVRVLVLGCRRVLKNSRSPLKIEGNFFGADPTRGPR